MTQCSSNCGGVIVVIVFVVVVLIVVLVVFVVAVIGLYIVLVWAVFLMLCYAQTVFFCATVLTGPEFVESPPSEDTGTSANSTVTIALH